jgi:hypothetical protein
MLYAKKVPNELIDDILDHARYWTKQNWSMSSPHSARLASNPEREALCFSYLRVGGPLAHRRAKEVVLTFEVGRLFCSSSGRTWFDIAILRHSPQSHTTAQACTWVSRSSFQLGLYCASSLDMKTVLQRSLPPAGWSECFQLIEQPNSNTWRLFTQAPEDFTPLRYVWEQNQPRIVDTGVTSEPSGKELAI